MMRWLGVFTLTVCSVVASVLVLEGFARVAEGRAPVLARVGRPPLLRAGRPLTPTPPTGVWTVVSTPLTRAHYSVACATATDCWIANARQIFPTDPPSTTFGLSPMMRWQGVAWQVVTGTPAVGAVDFSSPDNGWAAWGECERVLSRWCTSTIYRWNGTRWQYVTTLFDYGLIAIDAVTENDVWFTGTRMFYEWEHPQHILEELGVYHWNGNMVEFITQESPPLCSGRVIQEVKDGSVWIACGSIYVGVSQLVHYDTATAAWSYYDLGGGMTTMHAMRFLTSDSAWLATDDQLMYFYSGTVELQAPPGGTIYDLEFLDELHGWGVGYGQGVRSNLAWYSDDTWQTISTPVTNTLVDMTFAPDNNNGWAVSFDRFAPPGGSDVVLRYQRTDLTWRVYLPLMAP